MANEEQLEILKQGVEVWNKWREENTHIWIDLFQASLVGAELNKFNLAGADLSEAILRSAILNGADLSGATLIRAKLAETIFIEADLSGAVLREADLTRSNLMNANLSIAKFDGADLSEANLRETIAYAANFIGANLSKTDLRLANLSNADFRRAFLREADFTDADLQETSFVDADLSLASFEFAKFSSTRLNGTIFGSNNLSVIKNMEEAIHEGPSVIGKDTFSKSRGGIPEIFLRGCGLSDWEIESIKLYNPDLNYEEINKILYTMYDLRAGQAIQISPLFISYSHVDSSFVDTLGGCLNKRGIRFWRDVHHATAGPLEKQIDRAMRLNPTVLVILSKNSIKSDWVEHEVRTARELEKELERDVLCPVALDDSWKSSPWPKRVMEHVMEYNILDFSAWEDDGEFEGMFRRLIDGLELFYKG